MRKIKRIHIPLHIYQREGGIQGQTKEPCQKVAEGDLPSHHSTTP